MPLIIQGILPILLLVALGWALKRHGVIAQEHWNGFEKVTYLVLFPALIIHALAKANLKSVPAADAAIAMVSAVFLIGAVLIAIQPVLERRFGISGPTFTSIFQGSTRWNTMMAFGLAASLFGERGLTIVAVIAGIIPLMLNIACVIIMHRYAGAKGGIDVPGILRNPFVWSSLVGITLNFSGLPIPGFLMTATDYLGRSALAGSLLLIGSGLMLSDLGKPSLAVILTTGIKLFALPLIAITVARQLGVGGQDLATIVLCAAVPTAPAAYILSRQMGGDHRTMAAITTLQTILSALTLPAYLMIFG